MDEQIQKKRNYEKRNTGKKSRITATTVIAEVLTTFDKLQISVVYIATFVQMPGNEHNKRQFNIWTYTCTKKVTPQYFPKAPMN